MINVNQFRVFEHLSYDMIHICVDTIHSAGICFADKNRLFDSVEYTIKPSLCKIRLFPDYQFNAQEFANR